MSNSAFSPTSGLPSPCVAMVGGGLAGIAAAAAAVEQGCRVELFEQAAFLGGRAGSFHDRGRPGCRLLSHLAMGCCTNLLDLCRRMDMPDAFRRCATLHFFAPEGGGAISAARLASAPLHLLPALLRQKHLRLSERFGAARCGDWLPRRQRRIGPTRRSASGSPLKNNRRRPSAVLGADFLIALAETPDLASPAAARKVLVDGFLAARDAYTLRLPRLTLGEWIDGRMGEWLANRGAVIHRGSRVKRIEGDGRREPPLSSRTTHGAVSISRPRRAVGKFAGCWTNRCLRPCRLCGGDQSHRRRSRPCILSWKFARLCPAAGRAADRLTQWLFADPPGNHCQAVVSASDALKDRPREDIVREVLGDLQAIWPEAREAKTLHHRGRPIRRRSSHRGRQRPVSS